MNTKNKIKTTERDIFGIGFTDDWSGAVSLEISSTTAGCGYEIWLMFEPYNHKGLSEEEIYTQRDELIESFIDNYFHQQKHGGLVYCDDDYILEGILDELEEKEEEYISENPDWDEPDPDAEYDRMKDEGLLNR